MAEFCRSRAGFSALLAQWCSSKYWCFLVVDELVGVRRSGLILVPEGRNGEGWRMFMLELCLVGNFFQSSFAARLSMDEGKKLTSPVERGKKLFAEVLQSPAPALKGTSGIPKMAAPMGYVAYGEKEAFGYCADGFCPR